MLCMKPSHPQFQEILARIRSGELTRAQAAAEYGLNPGSLNTWISRSGQAHTLPSRRGKAGTAAERAEKDPDKVAAMEAAVKRVLTGEISALAMAQLDPRVNPRTLAAKVRQARLKAGLPVQAKRSRTTKEAE